MTTIVLIVNLISAAYFLWLHVMSLMGIPSSVSESVVQRRFWIWFVPFALAVMVHRFAVRIVDDHGVRASVSGAALFGSLPVWAAVAHGATLLYSMVMVLTHWPFPATGLYWSELTERVVLATSLDLLFSMGGLTAAHSAWRALRVR